MMKYEEYFMLGESIELYVLIEQKEHYATQKNQGLEALDQSLGLIFPSQGLTLARQCIILNLDSGATQAVTDGWGLSGVV